MAPLGTPDSEENLPAPDPTTPHIATPSNDFATRRSLRAAESTSKDRSVSATAPAAQPAKARNVAARSSAPRASVAVPAVATKKPSSRKRVKGSVINIAVMTLAAGLVATMAIPAYAFNPQAAESAQFKSSAIDSMKKAQPQSVQVSQTVAQAAVTRDAASATTEAQLASQKAEAERAQVAVQFAAYSQAYSGPSVSDFLANPPYPNFSLAQVFNVAKQYIGVPYVFGGATPAGFDCSGYVMFVYAQFGISLPHSVSGEAARGKVISIQNAVPGDLIVMPGHIGFYAGNGNIMDAPDSGRSISIRPIWTSDYYVVRLGI